MLRVELHCHTIYSKDSLTTPQQLLEAARRKKLDRVAITDHNTIDGALRAQQLDPGRVIVGEEIMTDRGELLAYFVREEIPAGLSPLETIARLRAQGAFISVSHPFDQHRQGSWQAKDLEALIPEVDAVETFNSRCLLPSFNDQAQSFASRYGLPGTAGSDSHATWELGKSVMCMPDFQDAESFRQALKKAQTELRLSPFWVHLYSRWSVWMKKAGLAPKLGLPG